MQHRRNNRNYALDYTKNWVKDLCDKKQSLYDDMVKFYCYKAIIDVLKEDMPMDICHLLGSFVVDEYENKSLILELQGSNHNDKKNEPARKKRKLSYMI